MTVSDLKKYKDNCYSALSRDITEFEKNFLFISGGLLAFSITFIKDIIKISDAQYLWLLFLSWLIIITSIGLMMFSFLKSANASDCLWKLVDDFLMDNNLHKDDVELTTEQWSEIKMNVNDILFKNKLILKKLRIWAVRLFLIGLLTFSTFVAINLNKENRNNTTVVTKK